MKFLLFSDLHHMPGVFMGGTYEDLNEIQRRAETEKCDFIIHAGDFCHGPSDVPDYVKAYNDFHIPSYHALGNHDTDHTPYEETLKMYNMPDGHYFFDCGGYRMVIVDPNYYCVDGEYIHYSMGNYYKFGAYRDHVPPEQLRWLEETIASSPYPCVLISHESFERDANGVQNRQAVRDIIDAANARRPHSVIFCINGHYHRDFVRVLNGVCYMEINSASYDWLDIEHDFFPEELRKEFSAIHHTVVYDDPLYAVVTLEGNTIAVEGMTSTFFRGVTREMTANPDCDANGRPCTATVQSFRMTLD